MRTTPDGATPRPAPLAHEANVRAQFGPVAGNYASARVHRQGPDLEAMLPAAGLRGDERVLDVGCGAGHTGLAFAPHVASVEAFDLTRPMLDQVERLARERGVTNLGTRLGDAEALPYADASFDLVTCRLCAHHFHRPAEAVREMARVLANEGVLLLVDIVAPEEPDVDSFLNSMELLRDPSHVRDHSTSQWLALFEQAGLAAQRLETWPMRQDFGKWVQRIGAGEAAEAALRTLFGAASRDVREAMKIDDDLAFEFTNALFRARHA